MNVTLNGRRTASGEDGNKGIPAADLFRIQASLGGPAAHVRASIDGGRPIALTPGGMDPNRWSTDEDPLAIGEYRVAVEVFDELGRKVAIFDSPVFIQEVDVRVTAGGSEVPSGVANGVMGDPLIPITGVFTAPVESILFAFDRGIPVTVNSAGGSQERFVVPWEEASAGWHRLEMEAFDAAGMKVSAYGSDVWVFRSFGVGRVDDDVILTWEGGEVLQVFDAANREWFDWPDARSPFQVPTNGQVDVGLFRLRAR